MKYFLSILLVTLSGAAAAQPADIVTRPDALTATIRFQTQDSGRVPDQFCVVVCGADFLDVAT